MRSLTSAPSAEGRPPRRSARALGGAFSAVVHASILLALFATWAHQPDRFEPLPMTVSLVRLQPPAPTVTPPAAAKPSPAKPPPPHNLVRPSPLPPIVQARPVSVTPTAVAGPGLSESQLVGAETAGSGAAGRPCDMVRWVQSALRKDPLVQTAVAGGPGRAIMVWDGDWVRNGEEDGKGLAAVREAIMWEVAFAPKACRAEAVHGLVLISPNERGSTRLALGSGEWRWSDLLTPRRSSLATP